MSAYTALVDAMTKAIAAAAKAGMSRSEIQEALTLIAGLVENADEE